MSILSSITSPDDVRLLDKRQLDELSSEIRAFLIENVAKTGGHLASNLGVVELTLAIHRVYDTSKDRVVFDVGHQCYVHKLLTGRIAAFSTLRCLDGLSGYPKPSESIHDAAVAGHASSSISVALGMARARTLMHDDYSVASLIGDGAMTGGLAFEGMCSAAASGEPMVVILNDNGMAIDGNVGGMASLLSKLHLKPQYIDFKRKYRKTIGKIKPIYDFNHSIKEWFKKRLLPHSMFEDLGFMYFGPVDGHDITQLEAVLSWAKEQNCPTLVHVITQKGRGYSFAEENPEAYHGVGAFDSDIGIDMDEHKCFSCAFGDNICELAEKDGKICAITAAMCSGTGLTKFAEKFGDRFFDVGITEGNAVSMSAGMAKQGLVPVFAVYSTFLQRSYDMLIHDVTLSNLHVVLAVDRAGIVGRDGETHQGVFDVAFLSSVPNMTILCPASYAELKDMLGFAVYRVSGPVAVRYPRGMEGEYKGCAGTAPANMICEGSDITVVTYGIMLNNVLQASRILEAQGISTEIIKLNLINPLDYDIILASVEKTGRLLTVEDVCARGSVGMRLLAAAAEQGVALKSAAALNLGEGIVSHGSARELEQKCGIDAESIADTAIGLVNRRADE